MKTCAIFQTPIEANRDTLARPAPIDGIEGISRARKISVSSRSPRARRSFLTNEILGKRITLNRPSSAEFVKGSALPKYFLLVVAPIN